MVVVGGAVIPWLCLYKDCRVYSSHTEMSYYTNSEQWVVRQGVCVCVLCACARTFEFVPSV